MKATLIAAAAGVALLAGGTAEAAAKSKYGYGHHYSSLEEARAYGHCLYPRQIRHKLSY